MRGSATGSSTGSSSTSTTSPRSPAVRTGTPAELRDALGGPLPPRRRRRAGGDADAGRRRARPHAARRPPALLRPRAGPVVVRRRARRLAGHGLQRDRRPPGRAAPARRPSSWSCSTGCASCSACPRAPRGCCERRVAGQRDRRSRRRAPLTAPGCRLPVRPDPLLDRARPDGATASPADAGAACCRPTTRLRLPVDAVPAAVASATGRPAGGRLRRGHRRHDQHRRRRPAAELAELCAGRGDLAARRRRLRRPGGALRSRSPRAGRDRAGRLGGARPAQVAVPAVRRRLPAGHPAAAC